MRRRSYLGANGSPCNTFWASLLWLWLVLLFFMFLLVSVTHHLPRPHKPLSIGSRPLSASSLPLVVQVQARIQQEAQQRERAQAADELAAELSTSETGLAVQSSQGGCLALAACLAQCGPFNVLYCRFSMRHVLIWVEALQGAQHLADSAWLFATAAALCHHTLC